MMASLDKFYDKQAIDIEQYLEYAPKNVVPFKDRMLKKIKEQREQQAEMEKQLLQLQQTQPDPAALAEQQLQQQEMSKDKDHQRKLELELVKGDQQRQLATMKQPVNA